MEFFVIQKVNRWFFSFPLLQSIGIELKRPVRQFYEIHDKEHITYLYCLYLCLLWQFVWSAFLESANGYLQPIDCVLVSDHEHCFRWVLSTWRKQKSYRSKLSTICYWIFNKRALQRRLWRLRLKLVNLI